MRNMDCENCEYTDLFDWEQDERTGKATPVYWCEKHREFCSDISECRYKAENEKYVNFADDLIPIMDEAESEDV